MNESVKDSPKKKNIIKKTTTVEEFPLDVDEDDDGVDYKGTSRRWGQNIYFKFMAQLKERKFRGGRPTKEKTIFPNVDLEQTNISLDIVGILSKKTPLIDCTSRIIGKFLGTKIDYKMFWQLLLLN